MNLGLASRELRLHRVHIHAVKGPLWRPQTIRERFVDFRGISGCLDTAKADYIAHVAPAATEMMQAVIDEAAALVGARDIHGLKNLKARKNLGKIASRMKGELASLTAYGRQCIHDERERAMLGHTVRQDRREGDKGYQAAPTLRPVAIDGTMGVDPSELMDEDQVSEYQGGKADAWATRIGNSVADEVSHRGMDFIKQGLDIAGAAAMLLPLASRALDRGLNASANNMVNEAFNMGRGLGITDELMEVGMAADGVVAGIYSALNDIDTCGTCMDLDGQAFAPTDPDFYRYMDGNPDCEGTLGGNTCFPTGTVLSADGIEGALRRWYAGDMVEVVTASGNKLSGTPNHPILTPDGWIPLGLLQEGDNVICGRFRDGMRRAGPDKQDLPTGIQQVYEALTRTGAPKRVTGVAINFHGEIPQGDVDVVAADHRLLERFYAFGAKPSTQLSFANPDTIKPLLLGKCRQRQACGACLRTSHGIMGGSGQSLALLGAGTGHAGEHSFRAVAAHDSGFLQDALNARPSLAVMPRDSDLSDAARVQVEKLTQVRRYPFAGHVYNLQTASQVYAANGIIVHNCRCMLFLEYGDMAPPAPGWSGPNTGEPGPPPYGNWDTEGLPLAASEAAKLRL